MNSIFTEFESNWYFLMVHSQEQFNGYLKIHYFVTEYETSFTRSWGEIPQKVGVSQWMVCTENLDKYSKKTGLYWINKVSHYCLIIYLAKQFCKKPWFFILEYLLKFICVAIFMPYIPCSWKSVEKKVFNIIRVILKFTVW